jgi:hypothetical protein
MKMRVFFQGGRSGLNCGAAQGIERKSFFACPEAGKKSLERKARSDPEGPMRPSSYGDAVMPGMPNLWFVVMEGQINTNNKGKYHFLLSAARRLFFAGPVGFPGFFFLCVFPYGGAAG